MDYSIKLHINDINFNIPPTVFAGLKEEIENVYLNWVIEGVRHIDVESQILPLTYPREEMLGIYESINEWMEEEYNWFDGLYLRYYDFFVSVMIKAMENFLDLSGFESNNIALSMGDISLWLKMKWVLKELASTSTLSLWNSKSSHILDTKNKKEADIELFNANERALKNARISQVKEFSLMYLQNIQNLDELSLRLERVLPLARPEDLEALSHVGLSFLYPGFRYDFSEFDSHFKWKVKPDFVIDSRVEFLTHIKKHIVKTGALNVGTDEGFSALFDMRRDGDGIIYGHLPGHYARLLNELNTATQIVLRSNIQKDDETIVQIRGWLIEHINEEFCWKQVPRLALFHGLCTDRFGNPRPPEPNVEYIGGDDD